MKQHKCHTRIKQHSNRSIHDRKKSKEQEEQRADCRQSWIDQWLVSTVVNRPVTTLVNTTKVYVAHSWVTTLVNTPPTTLVNTPVKTLVNTLNLYVAHTWVTIFVCCTHISDSIHQYTKHLHVCATLWTHSIRCRNLYVHIYFCSKPAMVEQVINDLLNAPFFNIAML